ncbi:lipoate--protein ligase family protein [Paeniglutamicibacter sp. ABSL32-1]|uniref:lipoate--protein ligase family protein n=1 Tax=Paeniglutamicibacter quisquiliarum TaxID=2849498 RepID=UPI001C2DDD8D|nr:lipoate--protein ligase family protein [Paeniglutamicibacter quisquiliarum]MBV1778349.1 lipoate--protein ligase family protein [Paeniglutamicibacter quisquiliarum]
MSLWNPDADHPLHVRIEDASGDPEADLGAGIELLGAVRNGEAPATLRIYRPDPTLAFGQRDVRLAGYALAVARSLEHGFAPVVRKAGGRAAAYHRGTVIVDHVEPAAEAMMGHQHRFKALGALYADALRRGGIDARVGEIAGEYCAGEFSVHGVPGAASRTRNEVKLVGTAQRVVSGAWLFSSVFVIEDSAPIRALLDDVYLAMEIPMDPATVGAADDLLPGYTTEAFIDDLLAEYAVHAELVRA